MRQCPAGSGAFLDEAIRPAIIRVALHQYTSTAPKARAAGDFRWRVRLFASERQYVGFPSQRRGV